MNRNLESLRKSIGEKNDLRIRPKTIPFKRKWTFREYNYLIQGFVCVLTAFLLLSIIILKIKQMEIHIANIVLSFCILLIATFCLTKGIYTIIFHFRKSEFSKSVGQHLLSHAYNQLYFTYERMLWLWLLAPVLLVTFPLIASWSIVANTWLTIVYFVISVVYGILLWVFSKSLWRKKSFWKNEINRLSNELQ